MLKQVLCASVMLTININVKITVMNYYVTRYAEKDASKPDFHVHLLYRGGNPDKSFMSFHSHLYNFALKFIFFKLM